ncbi:MAG TPA: glutathionylspermidine synthase family protein [Solimonas sp.]|nr:glutathionylspermidine synthase family protein [Solimonas sp.]
MSGDGAGQAQEVRLQPLEVDFARYRREVIFGCYKWDPQVGDVDTVCDHACVLGPAVAARLATWAEALAVETCALEKALLERADLYTALGLPRALHRLLARGAGTGVRVMRFDFHPTVEGWALSEVNSDVPGGFSEASALPRLAAQYVAGAAAQGDAGEMLAAAVLRRLGGSGRIALVHATSYADDRQVMQFLAARLAAAGAEPVLAAPDHLRWHDGRASLIAEGGEGAVDGVVRFFPAEWLPGLPKRAGWQSYFDNDVVSCNHPRALLTQSKRLPLLWDQLGLALPAWRALLPETRAPRAAPWRRDSGWVIKPAFGRVGEGVAWRGLLPAREWRAIGLDSMVRPRAWIAQRRFDSRPLASRAGVRHLCIGAFTVDGQAAGFYGRLASRPRVDQHAQDIAVLVSES